MTILKLKSKWDGQDIFSNNNLEEQNILIKNYEKDLQSTFSYLLKKIDAKLINCQKNEDMINGYIEKDNKLIYFNFQMPFENSNNSKIDLSDNSWMGGILLRKVKDFSDCVGGNPKYCNIEELNNTVSKMFL